MLRERCVEQWAAHSCVGDVWVAFAGQFSVYQTYIRGHREAILALDSLDSRREFGRWMRELEEANPGVKVRNVQCVCVCVCVSACVIACVLSAGGE